MTPVEIIALVFVVFALIKLAVIAVNPSSWISAVKNIYAKPVMLTGVALILGAIVLKYLLEELTIVQIFAAMTFMMALMMIQFAALSNEIKDIAERFLKDRNLLRRLWLPLILWIALMAWVLFEIFV